MLWASSKWEHLLHNDNKYLSFFHRRILKPTESWRRHTWHHACRNEQEKQQTSIASKNPKYREIPINVTSLWLPCMWHAPKTNVRRRRKWGGRLILYIHYTNRGRNSFQTPRPPFSWYVYSGGGGFKPWTPGGARTSYLIPPKKTPLLLLVSS